MEDKIINILDKLNRTISTLTTKQEKEVRQKEIEKIQKTLIELEGEFKAYRNVLKMIRGEEDEMYNVQ